jgi:hypothetical protein
MKELDTGLVELVTEAVESLAKSKGYLTYPREADVRLVLQALHIVNKALEVINETGRCRKGSNTG